MDTPLGIARPGPAGAQLATALLRLATQPPGRAGSYASRLRLPRAIEHTLDESKKIAIEKLRQRPPKLFSMRA